ALCCLSPADVTPEALRAEMAALEGEWSMVSGEANGEALPEEVVKGAKRVSKGGETTVSLNGEVFMKAKYTVDPSKKPKAIDYAVTEGMAQGKKQLGIYELKGDTLKVCFAAPDQERPSDFKGGEGRILSVWKRAKK